MDTVHPPSSPPTEGQRLCRTVAAENGDGRRPRWAKGRAGEHHAPFLNVSKYYFPQMGAELYSAVPSTDKALLLLASWRLSFKAWWRLGLPRAQLSCAFISDVCTPVSLLGCQLPGFSPQLPILVFRV